jgi:hypothetical protein
MRSKRIEVSLGSIYEHGSEWCVGKLAIWQSHPRTEVLLGVRGSMAGVCWTGVLHMTLTWGPWKVGTR